MDFSLSTALLGSLLSSLVLTGAMMYLASRPDATASLRWWTAGFALLFLRYALILLKPYIGETASDFLAESSHALSALIIFVGTARMMGRRLPFWPITLSGAAAVVWTAIAVYWIRDFFWLALPLYFFAGTVLCATGVVMFRQHRRERGQGYGLAAIGFFLWGLHKFDYPFLRPLEGFAPIGFMMSQLATMHLSVVLILIALNRQSRRAARQSDRVRYFSEHDLLTGLPSRRTLTTILDRAMKNSEAPLLVVFLDIRKFHEINEGLGQKIGDQVLRTVARRLYDTGQGHDIIARVGGDEFAIVVHSSPEEEALGALLRRITVDLESPIPIGEQEIRVDATIGVAYYPRDGRTAEEVMKNAGTALSDARRSGVRFRDFGELRSGEMLERMNLRRDLFGALKREEFFLVYQPQIDLATGQICGLEALMRWKHPQRGDIPPTVFVPLAESTEFILLLGEWVLDQALKDLARLEKAGFSLRLAVNLSAVQFKHEELTNAILRFLDSAGVSPDRLELEITESTVIHDERFVERVMDHLHRIGLQFAIDDFGTGYSSLSVLRRLPFDRLKIDRSFIQDVATDAGVKNIVEAIIWMAHSLNLKVLAEGVETDEQLTALKMLGCDEAQGYLLGRPVSLNLLIDRLSREAGRHSTESI